MEEILKYRDILTGEKSIAQWATERKTTRQNIHALLVKALSNALEENKYAEIVNKIKEFSNSVVKINNFTTDADFILIFRYANKKNIFIFGDNYFYCSIEKDSLNKLIKETLQDMHEVNVKKALEASNITSDDDFIYFYEKNSIIDDLKIRPLDFIEKELSSYDKPIDKEELIERAVSFGFKRETIKNIIRLTTNNKDTIVALGDMVCEKDVFFNKYIDMGFANQFTLATVAICEQNNICSTDIKWIKASIEKKYPEINTSRYSLYELKAILCNEPQFKKDVKFNIIYLDKQCQFQPNNMGELVERILEDYTLPISFGFLYEQINKLGKDFSRATLASTVLPNSEKVCRVGGGWILNEHKTSAEEFNERVKELNAVNICTQLKKDFKVVTLSDLAKKLDIPLYLIMDFNYGSASIEHFMLRLVENDWMPSLSSKNRFRVVSKKALQ